MPKTSQNTYESSRYFCAENSPWLYDPAQGGMPKADVCKFSFAMFHPIDNMSCKYRKPYLLEFCSST